MRTMTFTKAFPRRSADLTALLPLLEATLKTAKGDDGKPLVVAEDFDNADKAQKAANCLRNHVSKERIDVCVSWPKDSRTIYLYRGKPRRREKPANKPDSSAE